MDHSEMGVGLPRPKDFHENPSPLVTVATRRPKNAGPAEPVFQREDRLAFLKKPTRTQVEIALPPRAPVRARHSQFAGHNGEFGDIPLQDRPRIADRT